jgi:DNA gyrase/topoisomerase IV subunit B
MYLGADEEESRLEKLVSAALLAVLTDAQLSERTNTVFLGASENAVSVRHEGTATPLTRLGVPLEQLDLVMSEIGVQAKLSGVAPWSITWIGFPLVNAFSEEFVLRCVAGPRLLVLSYRRGEQLRREELENRDGPVGIEVRFRPDPQFVSQSDRLVQAVESIFRALPREVSERVVLKDPRT